MFNLKVKQVAFAGLSSLSYDYTVGFIKIATFAGSIIEGEGDFVATFGANNTPIHMTNVAF